MTARGKVIGDFGAVVADVGGETISLPVRMTLIGGQLHAEVGPLVLQIDDSRVLAAILDEINDRAKWSES